MDTATIQLDITQPIKSITDAYEGDIAIKIKGKTIINGLGTTGNFGKDTNADGLADGWAGTNAGAFSLVNGEQTFTPTAQFGGIKAPSSGPSGTLIFSCVLCKTTDNTVSPDLEGVGTVVRKGHSGSGQYEKIGALLLADATPRSIYCALTFKTTGYVPISTQKAFNVAINNYPELVGLTNQQKLDWCLANLEYCDGMDSVRTIEVESVEKNLFDSYIRALYNQGSAVYDGDYIVANNGAYGGYTLGGLMFVSGKTYTLSFDYITSDNNGWWDIYNNEDSSFTNFGGNTSLNLIKDGSNRTKTITFTATKTIKDASVRLLREGSAGTVKFKLKSIQLEEGTTATAYEPYKERKTTINHTLRSIGATKDELEYRNGSITKIQRISDDGLTVLQTPIETKWFNPTRIKAFNGYNQFTVDSAGLTPQVEIEYPLNFEGAQYLSYFPRRPR